MVTRIWTDGRTDRRKDGRTDGRTEGISIVPLSGGGGGLIKIHHEYGILSNHIYICRYATSKESNIHNMELLGYHT